MIRTFYLVAAIVIALLLISLVALAQQVGVVPGDRFAWEMTGPGLEAIKSYRYEIEVDGQIQSQALAGVTCTLEDKVIECTAPIPVTTLGAHRLRVRSSDNSVPGMPAVEGAWSPMFLYVMRPVPSTPAKMRAVKPKGTL